MKRFGLIGASFVLVSSIVGCSNDEEIKITDALSAIEQLSNLNDFTLDIYNTSLGDKGFIYFTKDYYYDVYQYFIIDDRDAERLKEYTNELVYYCEVLDMYILGVTHFGTPWNGVPANWKDDDNE